MKDLKIFTRGRGSRLDHLEVQTVHQEDDDLVLDLALQQGKQNDLLENFVRVVHGLPQPTVVILLLEPDQCRALRQLGVNVVEELDEVGARTQSLVGHDIAGDHLAPQQTLLPGAGLLLLQLSAHRGLPCPSAANTNVNINNFHPLSRAHLPANTRPHSFP